MKTLIYYTVSDIPLGHGFRLQPKADIVYARRVSGGITWIDCYHRGESEVFHSVQQCDLGFSGPFYVNI